MGKLFLLAGFFLLTNLSYSQQVPDRAWIHIDTSIEKRSNLKVQKSLRFNKTTKTLPTMHQLISRQRVVV